ncbi:MAG: T9SS type A sorting domain-containing protein [Bacteroidales bacterium]|nr:T9SS type A sorting domain-containing protein [Bacteroidales bacterium]
MSRIKHITLTLCILLCVGARAQGGAESCLKLTWLGDTAMRVEFVMDRCAVAADGGQATLRAEGLTGGAPRAGLLELPQVSRLIALPRGAELTVKDYDKGHMRRMPLGEGVEPAAWQGANPKETERKAASLDRSAYGKAMMWRNGAPVEVEPLGVMGDRQLFRLTVHPAAYDPEGNAYLMSTHHTATLAVKGARPAKDGRGNAAPRLLVVARRGFRQGLQDFIQWKRQEGYDVEELYVDTNKRDSIKALMRPYFDNATPLRPAPQYILLVGDAAQIQAFVGTSRPGGLTTHSTDLYYAEYTGDWLPDAAIGRWPVNDTAELGAVVRKTLRYEQCRDMDTAALRRAVLVAGSESRNPAPTTTNGQVNYVSSALKSRLPEMDTLCFHNPASGTQTSAILAAIDGGAGMLNYTAHCTVGGWASPSVTFGSIDTLTSAQPMIYVNNCCRSNDFSGTCFGEQLLRKEGGGAIAVIGATNETLWEEDYYWAVGGSYPLSLTPRRDSLRPGAFDRLLDSGDVRTAGGLLQAGNMAVMASGTLYSRFYWEIYCLLGDPTLVPRLGTPRPLTLWAPDSVAPGTTEMRVSSTPGTTVAVIQGKRLLGTARYDNSDSSMLVAIEATADTTPLVVTASGPQMIPLTDTVYFTLPQGRVAVLHGVEATDSTLAFSLTNNGTDTLYALGVSLTPDGTGASFSTDTLLIDTLAPQATASLAMTVAVCRWHRWWGGTLAVVDGRIGDTLCRSTVTHWMSDTLPSLAFATATTDGRSIGSIEPRSTYHLTATAAGPCDSMSICVTALPHNDTIATLSTDLSIATLTLVTPDTLTHLHIEATARHGNYVRRYTHYLEAGPRTPRSDEVLGCYPWRHEGAMPWSTDSTTTHDGTATLRSGDIDYRQQSDLMIDVLMPQADSVVFWAKASTEVEYDWLSFEVDGVRKCWLWGEYAWRRYAVALTAGRHTLRWHYRKDDNNDGGQDCAWIDGLRLPLALWDEPHGCPGSTTQWIEPRPAASAVLLYPNPADEAVTVEATGPATAELADLYGRRVATWRLDASGSAKLDTKDIPTGVYLLLLHGTRGIEHRKLIIQH